MRNSNDEFEISREFFLVVTGREGQPNGRSKLQVALQLLIDIDVFFGFVALDRWQEVVNEFGAGSVVFPFATNDTWKLMRLVTVRIDFLVDRQRFNVL